ncbi:MAG: SIMPL domain-containing protein [Azonexus sp.]|jgi:predicted secreted protein|uniref:SIMPL domain-containing protein n=1 Tax=Azonexus sp. TaxID=1872668 RepID=UPI00283A88C5|nr:SIMPL domain-containing protein [Azonexus sp.]MDR0775915.1 SIMPL domain-containing protein [Azonexus sp.]
MRLPTLAALLTATLFTTAHAGPLIELSAEASQPAANDLLRASVFAEANGGNPAELARQINQDIGEALKLIRNYPAVTVKSGQQNTFPVYGQKQKLEGWRMRSELLLETKDAAAVSELLGKLQAMHLALGHFSQLPSPATRTAAEDAATRDAISAFHTRAGLIAEQFGKPYKINQLRVHQQGSFQPLVPMARAASLMQAAEAIPMPIEAGESQVTTNISGQIELTD